MLTRVAVQSYLESEVLGKGDEWSCPKCRSKVQASKALELWTLPEVLVVQLKRFSTTLNEDGSTTTHKLDSLVDFPLQVPPTPCAPLQRTRAASQLCGNTTVFPFIATTAGCVLTCGGETLMLTTAERLRG